MLSLPIIDSSIDTEACKKSNNGLIHHSQEQVGSSIWANCANQHWSSNAFNFLQIFSYEHQAIKCKAIKDNDEYFAHEDEHCGKSIGPSELHSESHVEKEPIPSRWAEILSWDGHVSIG